MFNQEEGMIEPIIKTGQEMNCRAGGIFQKDIRKREITGIQDHPREHMMMEEENDLIQKGTKDRHLFEDIRKKESRFQPDKQQVTVPMTGISAQTAKANYIPILTTVFSAAGAGL
jgi:hypothetical protein